MRGAAKAIVAAVGALAAAPAFAADLAPPSARTGAHSDPILPSTWHFEATIDGWAPSLSANVGLRNLPALPVYANIFQLLPHLEGIVPVSFVAYNDNFIGDAQKLLLHFVKPRRDAVVPFWME